MSRAGLYIAVCISVLPASPLSAGPSFEFWPGAQYDARIPTVRRVLGYDPGSRITSSSDILRYFDALAAASSRMQVFASGESWEKRKLVYATVET